MPILFFNNATDAATRDDVHINPAAVRFVEAALENKLGHTNIHVLGYKVSGIRVTEQIATVLASLPGLVQATRHYHAGEPAMGASTLFVAPHNLSFIRPNVPKDPTFWILRFTDESELRIVGPLPQGL